MLFSRLVRCLPMTGKRKHATMLTQDVIDRGHQLPPLPSSIRVAFQDGVWREERKALFTQTINMPAFKVPKQACHTVVKTKGDLLLRWPRIPAVQTPTDPEEEKSFKLVLLHTKTTVEEEYPIVDFPVTVTYDQYTASDLLKAILPEGSEVTTAFETIGHIAHLNLREDSLPYKDVVGHIIYDKNYPRIQTVVNKLDSIDTTFRFFKMEVIAGKEDFITSVSEAGCQFHLDYSKVYWNTRLSTEHGRLVKEYFKRGDSIADVMAGVGPFAIPAARQFLDVPSLREKKRKKLTGAPPSSDSQEAVVVPFVFANDLNPESYKWLTVNAEKNKVKALVRTYNLDGAAFIKQSFTDAKSIQPAGQRVPFQHYVMNLPASAIEFIGAYRGLYTAHSHRIDQTEAPFLHLYTFSTSEVPTEDILARMSHYWKLPADYLDAQKDALQTAFHMVRKVSPKKEMWRVSMRIPLKVLYNEE